jgi:putative transposase
MTRSKRRHRRPALRLPTRDYRRVGLYFITTVTRRRARILSEIRGANVVLSVAGRAVSDALLEVVNRFPTVGLDAHVIMPDHVHAIINLSRDGVVSLSRVVGWFKGHSARRINALRPGSSEPVWQRGYHDIILRTASDLARCRQYIAQNPRHWAEHH